MSVVCTQKARELYTELGREYDRTKRSMNQRVRILNCPAMKREKVL